MSDMSDVYAYASTGPIEPFWQRTVSNGFPVTADNISRSYRRPVGRLRSLLCALAVRRICVLLLVIALLAILVTGVRTDSRSSSARQGFLRPSTTADNDDLVSEYLPYKYAAMNLVLGVLVTLLQVISGGNEFIAIAAWLIFFVAISPAATMRLVMTGSLRGALNPTEMIALIERVGKPYAALAAFIFVAELCRSYGLAALAAGGGLSPASLKAGFGFGTVIQLLLLSFAFWYFTYMICGLVGYAMYQFAECPRYLGMGPGERAMRSVANARTSMFKARTRDALIGQLYSGRCQEAIDLLSHDLSERKRPVASREAASFWWPRTATEDRAPHGLVSQVARQIRKLARSDRAG